jgi:tetratricopeptide (TPR) repeat protein
MARRLATDNDTEEAKRVLQGLNEEFPNSPEILAQLAWVAEASNDQQTAIEYYQKALESEPSSQLAVSLALAMLRSGDLDGSRDTLSQWLQEHSNDASVMQSLGALHLLAEDTSEAVSLFQQVLREDPNNLAALNNLAWALRKDDPLAALSYAERAYQIDEGSAAVMETLGVVLLDQGSPDRAARLLKRASDANPDKLTTKYYLGLALSEIGRKAEAVTLLEQILSQDTEFATRNEAVSLLAKLRGY